MEDLAVTHRGEHECPLLVREGFIDAEEHARDGRCRAKREDIALMRQREDTFVALSDVSDNYNVANKGRTRLKDLRRWWRTCSESTAAY